jgi:ABC-type uncharacterized transport system substrate-binding protein
MAKSLLMCCLCVAVCAFAHPHVFVDATIKVVFDPGGFSSIKNHWVFDELYSMAMMSSGDKDENGTITEDENAWFCNTILEPLKGANYYNYVLFETSFLKVQKLKNFKATFKNNRLILDFETVFSAPVQADYSMLVLAVADPSNYIQVTTDMENAEVDGPESIDVDFFNDALSGLTLFRAFRSDIEGLYLRFKKK